MIKKNAVVIIFHLCSWLLFAGLIVSFITTSSATSGVADIIFSPWFFAFVLIYLAVFYLNTRLLIPALYFKKKYALYAAISLLFFVMVYFVRPFDHVFQLQQQRQMAFADRMASMPPAPAGTPNGPPPGMLMPPPPGRPSGPVPGIPGFRPRHTDIVSLVLLVMIYSLSWAVQIGKKWRSVEARAVQAEADKSMAELAFLKAQINPHFLFNTLNNIYSLAVVKSDAAPDAIMKLSKIMRYLTDEVRDDFVDLENEVSFIEDYIDLQRLRLTGKVQLRFSVQGSLANKQIAPLILMPFIENIFKYGISNHAPSDIVIQLNTAANQLNFFCSNKIFPGVKKRERTGIGIENTKERLQHLYPATHSLNISAGPDMFTVELSLPV